MPDENQDLNTTIHRFIGIAMRRRWWLIATTCGVACAVALGSLLLPNKFTSEATILVVQQQVPERYVTPNTTYNVQQALQSLTEAVLSRNRLLPIINDFGLYPGDHGQLGPEGLAQLMRSHIQIEPIQKEATQKDINAFKISFTCGEALVAQKVTDRLTSFFIDENLKLQEQQDVGTTTFLKDQLAAAENNLKQQEQRLRAFRTSNLGELPEQEQGNLEILSGLHTQLQGTMADLSRAQEQRVYLSSLLDQYRSLDASGRPAPGTVVFNDPLTAAQVQLDHLESERASLLARFTPEYPDVIATEQKIAEQKKLVARLRHSRSIPAGKQQTSPSHSVVGAENGTEAQLRSQLESNRIQLKDLTSGQKHIEQQIAVYERRLNQTPVREEQLSDILRGYDLAKKNYDDLLGKVIESEMATSLAQRQQGQRFRVVDPPSFPMKPSSPKRQKIALGGAAAGLILGAGLAFLIDSTDRSFHSEKDVMQRFKTFMVIGLPLTLTSREEKLRSWKRRFEWVGAAVLLITVMLAEFYVLRKG